MSLRMSDIINSKCHFAKKYVYGKRDFFQKWTATSGNVPLKMCAQRSRDQPAHPRRLIWIFTGWILDRNECKVLSSGRWRLWSDCADVQADLSLCWTHVSERTFSQVAARILMMQREIVGKFIVYVLIRDSLTVSWQTASWHLDSTGI